MSPPTLQPDHGALARSDLPPALRSAIEAAADRQREGAPWEKRDSHRALLLHEGATFLPDEREAAAGSGRYIAGIVLGIVGVAFSHLAFTDRRAEDWMQIVGPGLLVLGPYLWWTGRQANAAASTRPRRSGVYLVGETLMVYREDLGCRVFPRSCVRKIAWEGHGPNNRLRLALDYEDERGEVVRTTLSDRNLAASVQAWLDAG